MRGVTSNRGEPRRIDKGISRMTAKEKQAASRRLKRAGDTILRSASAAHAQASALEQKWDAQLADKARSNLCTMLHTLLRDQFWADLTEAVNVALDPRVLQEILAMDLRAFEASEVETFRAAGVPRDLARSWASEAKTLLVGVRLGFEDRIPDHLRPDIGVARESVRLAREALCEKNVRLTDPRKGKSGKRKFRKFLSGIEVVTGLGSMTANGGLLLAGVLTGGVTSIFGGGTLLAGFWTSIHGAKDLARE